MSETTNNGGPAFPCTKIIQHKYMDEGGYGRTKEVAGLQGGMTLRDYFAAKAMQGILSNSSIHGISGFNPERESIDAYMFADAMLSARGQS